MTRIPDQIFQQIIWDVFDQPVISNLYRPHYVERMIALALGEEFKLVSADWSGWDIETREGVRIEVKQSAAWQTWSNATGDPKPSSGVFDISAKTGHWTDGGATWVPKAGHQAHLYIFAWHPITERDKVDHRDPAQWLFYVAPTAELPAGQKTISQSIVAQRWPERRFSELQDAVLELISELAAEHKD